MTLRSMGVQFASLMLRMGNALELPILCQSTTHRLTNYTLISSISGTEYKCLRGTVLRSSKTTITKTRKQNISLRLAPMAI